MPTDAQKKKKIKTIRVAMCLSYVGKDYYGVTRTGTFPTIESEMLTALLKNNIITQEEHEKPYLLNFGKASRTDRGVSALRQVISVDIEPIHLADLKHTLNSSLPPQIQVMDVKRTNKLFYPHTSCCSRSYCYLFPSFTLARMDEVSSQNFRVTDSHVEELNSILSSYQGRHNFYNFTAQRKLGDPSLKREVYSMKCGLPFYNHGLEWLLVKIHGQSFMLHQIRKMLGLAFSLIRGLGPPSLLQTVWEPSRVNLPIAPGLGLILEEPHYTWYNKTLSSQEIMEPLVWDQHQEEIHRFRVEHVYPTIMEMERHQHSMLSWLEQTLISHNFMDENFSSLFKAYPFYNKQKDTAVPPLLC